MLLRFSTKRKTLGEFTPEGCAETTSICWPRLFKNKEQNPSTFARSALDVVKLNADDAFLKRFVASHNFVAFCFLFITPRGDDEKRSSPNLTLPGTLAGPELR